MGKEVWSAAPLVPERPTLKKLQVAAAGCTACPLWKTGTQTVFGDGAANVRQLTDEIVELGLDLHADATPALGQVQPPPQAARGGTHHGGQQYTRSFVHATIEARSFGGVVSESFSGSSASCSPTSWLMYGASFPSGGTCDGSCATRDQMIPGAAPCLLVSELSCHWIPVYPAF